MYNYLKNLLIIFSACHLLSCSANTQFTQILTAQPFVSQLYSQTQKTLTLSTNEGDTIAWIALSQPSDNATFKIEMVNDFKPKTVSANTVYENFLVTTDPFKKIPAGTNKISGPLKIRVSYSPLAPIKSQALPHHATLLIAYEKPDLGMTSIDLYGYTKGICDPTKEKCSFSSTSDLTGIEYKLVNDTMDLYICHPDIATEGLANDADHENTRKDLITVEGNIVVYVNGDKSAVHIVRDDDAKLIPTIPLFQLPVPPLEKVPPDFELSVELRASLNAECAIDADGIFRCDDVVLDVGKGLASLSAMVVTNGEESPISDKCPNFGTIAGEGTIDKDQLTLVAWGTMEDNYLKKALDAVVIAVLPLEKIKKK